MYYSEDVGEEPNTPLMESAPTSLPVQSSRIRSRPNTAGPHANGGQWRKRDKMACAGVLILGGIIALGLVIVAIKEATDTPDYVHLKGKAGNEETTTQVGDTTISDTTISVDTTTSVGTTTSIGTTTTATNAPTTNTPTTVQQTNLQDGSETSTTQIPDTTDTSAETPDESPPNIFDDNSVEVEEQSFEQIQNQLSDLSIEDEPSNLEDIKSQLGQLDQSLVTEGPGTSTQNSPVTTLSTQTATSRSSGGDDDDDTPEDTPAPRSGTSRPGKIVYCDPERELRCRDMTQCYPVNKHCDFKVDCNDYSDEDNCTCKQRLIDARLCDGHVDCREGDDEVDCKCPQDQFFCEMQAFDKPVCVKQDYTCDAVEDCKNGRDEDGCILNFPHTLDLALARPAFSHKSGLLTVLVGQEYRHLAVSMDQEHLLAALAIRTCDGLIDFDEATYKIIEYDFDSSQAAIIDSFDNTTKRYSFSKNDRRNNHIHLVHVSCEIKTCFAYSSRDKRSLYDMPIECEDYLAGIKSTNSQKSVSSTTETHLHRRKRAHDLPLDLLCTPSSDLPDILETRSLTSNSTGRIVGGFESKIELWPSTVALYRNSKFICGGTLINPQWIITAGHCLYKYEKKDVLFRIRIGMQRKQSLSPWEQTRVIKEVYMHPEYEPVFLRHDLALGKLDSPVLINRLAQPVCLPFNQEMTPDPGTPCTAAGWGLISERGLASEQLKEVKLNVLDRCGRAYNDIKYQICAGGELGRDSCQGDSGGPLYCDDPDSGEHYLGGVISHGKGCGREDEPGVYMRLSMYYQWVENIMAGQIPKIGEPLQECPGLVCGSGECITKLDVCDEDVDCLDNGDVKYCVEINGYRVQKLPSNVTMGGDPDLGKVDDDPFEEKKPMPEISQDDKEKVSDIVEFGAQEEIIELGEEIGQMIDSMSGSSNRNLPLFKKTVVQCRGDQFQCKLMPGCIDQDLRCDGIPDCKDKSDEFGCTCGDLLNRTDDQLINNGYPDCEDGSDEIVTKCTRDQILCSSSNTCIGAHLRCNSKPDCPDGEDERNCAVLVRDDKVVMSKTGDLVKNNTGFLVIYSDLSWKPVCVSVFTNKLTNNLCNFMGFRSPSRFQLINRANSPMKMMGKTSNRNCNHVYIECGEPKCGDRVLVRQSGKSTALASSGPGYNPWTVDFLSDGKFVCSGSLIHPKYVITSISCGVSVLTRKGFNTVLTGQSVKSTYGWSPHAQFRRLVKFKIIQGTQIVLGALDKPLKMTDYVRNLCPAPAFWSPHGIVCQVSGGSTASWADAQSLMVAGKCGRVNSEMYHLCSCEDRTVDKSHCSIQVQTKDISSHNWATALACPDFKGIFYYVGLKTEVSTKAVKFSNLISSRVSGKLSDLLKLFQSLILDVSNDDNCPHRCKSGYCCDESMVCDGAWDCQDGSDEQNCKFELEWPLCTDTDQAGFCQCPKEFGQCNDNVCIPVDRFCDGTPDCPDGSDETADCNTCLAKTKFTNPSLICNGENDCDDGGDEAPAICGCPSNTFLCSDLSSNDENQECQPIERLCDGRMDCSLGSDESPEVCIKLESNTSTKDNSLIPTKSHAGHLWVKYKGYWKTYCTSRWSDKMSEGICKVLGYAGLSISQKLSPTEKVVDINYIETGIKSPPCFVIYIICKK